MTINMTKVLQRLFHHLLSIPIIVGLVEIANYYVLLINIPI